LRNGSVSDGQSISYRKREERLIPHDLWERDRARFVRDLGLPRSCETFLQHLEASLSAGLEAVAEAVADGAMTIDKNMIVLPKAKPTPEDPRLDRVRPALVRAIGETQLPAVLIEIDGLTRFSWILLGRPPRSEHELVTLYASIIALGTGLSAADLVRMVPSLGADSVGLMMLRLQIEMQLRAASDAVLAFLRSHPIAQLWGGGLFASADMMSLEATRYLWAARLDPRRRTYAVGTYTHVLDQWGILYDQPIVLNRRQAGAAIEGALRQQHVPTSSASPSTPTASRISPWRWPSSSALTSARALPGSRRESSTSRAVWPRRRHYSQSWPRPYRGAPSRAPGTVSCVLPAPFEKAGAPRPRRLSGSARPPVVIQSTPPVRLWVSCSAPSICVTISATRASAVRSSTC
jgi:hypothetical protein